MAEGPHTSSCRACGAALRTRFADLGLSPLCQKHVHPDEVDRPETFYPLQAFVCEECWLVQLGEYASPDEIFGFYHYLSSYSDAWLDHARRYVDLAVERFGLGEKSRVAEIASNDGYLLQYFAKRGIPALGIEPAANVAEVARQKGVETVVRFFGRETATDLARERGPVDLLIANNVLAHVPDLNDFVAGMPILLARDGVVTVEFPHLQRLVEGNQFDTIYHEHFSYFSFHAAEAVFASHGLEIFDVEELPTHGGSLRLYARHRDAGGSPAGERVGAMRQQERDAGMLERAYYEAFQPRIDATRRELVAFLIDAAERGKTVVGYGAPGKGNTLLNACGVRPDLLRFTVDRSPLKQGTLLPGTRIPVHAPERLFEARPDYVLILPWNLRDEIAEQLEGIREWGGRFVVPIPRPEVF